MERDELELKEVWGLFQLTAVVLGAAVLVIKKINTNIETDLYDISFFFHFRSLSSKDLAGDLPLSMELAHPSVEKIYGS